MKLACPACQDRMAFVLPPVEDQPRMVQCAGCKNISAIKPGDAQPAANGFEAKSFSSIAGSFSP
jgi:hypothetical protein